jgi:hypothetical protein
VLASEPQAHSVGGHLHPGLVSTSINDHPLRRDLLRAQSGQCVAGPHCRSGTEPMDPERASQLIVDEVLRGFGCPKCVHRGARDHSPDWKSWVTAREAADLLAIVPRGFPGLRRRSSSIAQRADDSLSLATDSELNVSPGNPYYHTRVHALYEKQLRRCSICRVSVRLGLQNSDGGDCDHLGAYVRGVLCRSCNCAVRQNAEEWTAFIHFYNVIDRWHSYVGDPPAARLLGEPLLHNRRKDKLAPLDFARLMGD